MSEGSFLSEINGLISALSAAVLAAAAWFGLNSWRRQKDTQVKMEFLDKLVDTVHEYLHQIKPAITVLEGTQIGIQSYSESEFEENKNARHRGLQKFAEAMGENVQKSARVYLDNVRPIKARMLSLVSKGQVFNFTNYNECINACNLLAWSCDQMESFFVIMCDRNLNRDNERVRELSDKLIENVTTEKINLNLEDNNKKFLEFVRKQHGKLLK